MDLIGIGYDWNRSFSSSDPSFYKWTQWIFEVLYKRGLAYRKLAAVNWDPVDKTVLADEEVIAGRAERSGALVEKKWIPQWYFKITEYAQRLIDDLDTVDWPEGIKHQQRNWIGRSEGVQFAMEVAGPRPSDDRRVDLDDPEPSRSNTKTLTFEVFTTRIDTIFGMTFCVLAPEHPVVEHVVGMVDEKHRADIRQYQEEAKFLSDIDRQAVTRDKTGVFTGAYAINPANGQKVPIYIADYVLITYGTGAIMAVPGHDERDYEFAQRYGIPVIRVIAPSREGDESTWEPLPFAAKDGFLVNSGEYSGMSVPESQQGLGEWIEALGIGQRKIQYKLRDWLISRQRYWGCPIPVIHTKEGEMQLVPDNCLPVELPMVDHYEPTGDGSSPLAHIPEFVNTTDLDGRLGQRETDTMGGFACSSWYFLRFTDPDNFEAAWNSEIANYWMPVDCYVGGAEHAVMHLLYARFWTKVLHDEGLIRVKEPFQVLRNQGQVLALTPYRIPREGEQLGVGEEGVLVSFAEARALQEDQIFWRWARMSKSKGNVVTPEEAVESYGADALRMYLLFVAPFEADVQWQNEGMQGMVRFLSRIFKLVEDLRPVYVPEWRDYVDFEEFDDKARAIRRATHQTIRNATTDIDRFSFNTYVSWLMKYANTLGDAARSAAGVSRSEALALSEAVEALVLLLAPGAPHTADELWSSLGKDGFTLHVEWPKWDDALAAEDLLTIAVQVSGKLRDTFQIAPGAPNEEYERLSQQCPKVLPYLEGKTVRKIIVVPGRLVNIVAS
jgi:leucyl-tRNA synthetase